MAQPMNFQPHSIPSIPLPALHTPIQSLGNGTAPYEGRPAPIRSHGTQVRARILGKPTYEEDIVPDLSMDGLRLKTKGLSLQERFCI